MFEGRLHLSGKYIAQNIGKNVVLEGFLTKVIYQKLFIINTCKVHIAKICVNSLHIYR